MLACFVLTKSLGFFLLHSYRDHVEQPLYVKVAETLVLRVLLCLMIVLFIWPPSTVIPWQVMTSHTLSALTIESYSATALNRLLKEQKPYDGLISPLLSALSLKIGLNDLPPSTLRRKLACLLLLPLFAFLGQFSILSNTIPSSSFEPSTHPVHHLAIKAEDNFNSIIKNQSRTLEACYKKYERKYGRKPPVNFDKWFYAAKQQGFLLIDEFDTMMMSLTLASWLDAEVLQTLPNITLAINTMDKAKIVVPHDILSRALRVAQDALSVSCPPDTPARDLSLPAIGSLVLTEIGFLENVTLSKEVCQFPELYSIHAGLRHPASMTITHSLVPVFSQSKPSYFNDLLYPSPFYAERMRMAALSNFTRIRMTAAVQYNDPAYKEQVDKFHIKEGQRDDVSEGYKSRYNLDLDGNGLSGRFYRLLMSKSAIIRYLTQEPEGQELGKRVAQNSYDWSRRVLRNEDMKLVWWRLMLEYGRLISDDRDSMFFSV
ncbi:Uncharacterized protein PECH_007162 [Penicillium ucsense]|uniref:Glycosyl transferase CAP10 domain-containing protein n=1 Tax=Penicillium ucsense TaxID=2839758 RepID=A0A8J8W8S3_9EURO|nr:Uncharacterized protein PECM_000771 [Penicillium ucsense]KAF7735095.1 Uncharacterized protein PECH_007162 [Penicillium ucsense]